MGPLGPAQRLVVADDELEAPRIGTVLIEQRVRPEFRENVHPRLALSGLEPLGERAVEIPGFNLPSCPLQRLRDLFQHGAGVGGSLKLPVRLVVREEPAVAGGAACGHGAQPVEVGYRLIRAEKLHGQRRQGRVFFGKLGEFLSHRFSQRLGDVVGRLLVAIGGQPQEGAFGIHRSVPLDGDHGRAAVTSHVDGVEPGRVAERGGHHRLEGRRQHAAALRAHQVHPQEQVRSAVPLGDRDGFIQALHRLDVRGLFEQLFESVDDLAAKRMRVVGQQQHPSGVEGRVLRCRG